MFFHKKESDSESIIVCMDQSYFHHDDGVYTINATNGRNKKLLSKEHIYDSDGIIEVLKGCLTILAVSGFDMEGVRKDIKDFFEGSEEGDE